MEACFIEPLDVVSVRDGRSFDAGGASLARALWPPSPWTVLGAIRARLIMAMGHDPSEYGGRGWASGAHPPAHLESVIRLLGRPEDPPTFRLGPVLLQGPVSGRPTTLFPAPLDLVSIETGTGSRHERLRVVDGASRSGTLRSGPTRRCWLLPPEEAHPGKEEPYRALTEEQARAWLQGLAPSGPEAPNPVVAESRIGIAMDPSMGRVQEGMFYQRRAHTLREGWRLCVPILEWPPELAKEVRDTFSGSGEIGGDRHPARFRLQEWKWADGVAEPVAARDRAVLWFLSPVRPEDLTDDNLSQRADAPVRVLAVASGRPVSIGGWSMWRGAQGVSRPRPMRRYHPAGTCVLVEGDVARLHGGSVATDRFERAAGFSVCLVGAWPRSSEGSSKEV